MGKSVWLNLDPNKVDVTHLEKRMAEIGCNFLAQAVLGNDPEQVLKMAKKADVVISIMEKWDDTALRQVQGQVKFIQKYGAGLDNIDLEAAARYGIPVANVPGANSAAVAEVALMHILNVGRKFYPCVNGVKNSVWPSTITGTELDGKTVGLMGYGFIAKHLIRLLTGFQVKILVFDPFVKGPEKGHSITMAESPEELFAQSDIVSLHIPFNPATKGSVNKKLFDRIKPGSYLINTCRGGVIDEDDLLEALNSGRIAAAGLDVLVDEPPKTDNPLIAHERVFVTSHMGAASFEAEHRSQAIMADAIETFLKGQLPASVKNKELLKK